MNVLLSLNVCFSSSLAVHPDKIRIATGQIAGVDKDGRVSFISAATMIKHKLVFALMYTTVQKFGIKYLDYTFKKK